MKPKRQNQNKQKNRIAVQENPGDTLSRIAQLSDPINQSNEKVHAVVTNSRFEGPLPPPDIFKRYSETIPDAPERILKQFEEDSAHVRNMCSLRHLKRRNRTIHEFIGWHGA